MTNGVHIAGDKIQAGDITGSIVALGRGAQVIVQQSQSAVEVAREQAKEDRLALAQSVERYTNALIGKAMGKATPPLATQNIMDPKIWTRKNGNNVL
jgi:hypothetical protein